MKYIDAEKLIAEIRKLCSESCISESDDYYEYAKSEIIDIITSLQQEQPNKYETALEKARKWMPNVNQGGHAILIDIFPELGEGLDPRYGGRKQEQPEVDLKEEITSFFSKNPIPYEHITDWPLLKNTALHFYELGLNARKED